MPKNDLTFSKFMAASSALFAGLIAYYGSKVLAATQSPVCHTPGAIPFKCWNSTLDTSEYPNLDDGPSKMVVPHGACRDFEMFSITAFILAAMVILAARRPILNIFAIKSCASAPTEARQALLNHNDHSDNKFCVDLTLNALVFLNIIVFSFMFTARQFNEEYCIESVDEVFHNVIKSYGLGWGGLLSSCLAGVALLLDEATQTTPTPTRALAPLTTTDEGYDEEATQNP